MSKPKILISDPISEKGIAFLQEDPALEVDVQIGLNEEALLKIIPQYSGLIVRSQTKVTAAIIHAATKLKAIGRAGAGVDNIDITTATNHGIVVMNTPGGNSVSTCEHAFSLLMSLSRNIPQADASIRAGKWERKKFQGVELNKKTLAILGMGRIGSELARRAAGFNMRVLAYDPYLSESRARALNVELYESLEEALALADYISLHLPANEETHHIFNEKRLATCKPGARIINCARGGLIDEDALTKALESGHIGGAAFDVYEQEPPDITHPLFAQPNVIFTPHLGASTAEAQENVGIEIAKTLRTAIVDGAVVNAVNMPSVDTETAKKIAPFTEFGEVLGRLLSQLAPKRAEFLRVNYCGQFQNFDTTLITRSVLKGYLESASGKETVNTINAPSIAKNRGLRFTESHLAELGEYQDLIEVVAGNEADHTSVAGSYFGNTPRIVKIRDRFVEATPKGVLLLLENQDVPGIVGNIGSLLAEQQINIAGMSLSRNQCGGKALTLMTLDSTPEESVLTSLTNLQGITEARILQLD